MLSSKIKVPLPEKGVIVRRNGKYHYVYKVIRTFRNNKGQPTNTRLTIGRLDDASGMLVPNDTYWEHFNNGTVEMLPTYDSVRSVGTSFLVTHVLESLGITAMLTGTLGLARASLVLTAALYIAARGNVFEYVTDFCEGFTLAEVPLNSQMASSLFSSITHDERMAFFKAWASAQEAGSYLAYDVTSFSTWAEGIQDTEWGYNRDGEKLPQINLGCYFSEASGLPVFYVTYPGSILDKSHMPYMMAYNSELGIHDVGFVMDRGFCSTANITYMQAQRLNFVIGVECRHKATREAIDKVRADMVSMRNHIGQGVYARTIHGRFYGVISSMHVYYVPALAERQRSDLFRAVEAMEEELAQKKKLTERESKRFKAYFVITRAEDGSFTFTRDYEKIDAVSQRNGYFCLLTNTDLSSADVLAIYRRKDVIEKGFDDLKNHLDMKRMRTHNTASTEGKMFVAFIALIAVSEIGVKLAEMMREKSWSKDMVIAELEKVRVISTSDGRRLMNPLTKTQRLLYKAFGLSEADLKTYVTRA
jgi:hypothetical protein